MKNGRSLEEKVDDGDVLVVGVVGGLHLGKHERTSLVGPLARCFVDDEVCVDIFRNKPLKNVNM